MAKEAVEQRTQELRKEGELLHKNLEQQMSLKRDEERSCQVGGQRTRLGLGKVAAGGGAASLSSEITLLWTRWRFHEASHQACARKRASAAAAEEGL